MAELVPFALKDAPALIETVFPVQKVSWEAQKERKAGAGQTLTALGSYWKGRKPLIQVRAIILGCLLPDTGKPDQDLFAFEQLMAFDRGGLARRAVPQNKLKPKDIAAAIQYPLPWNVFTHDVKEDDPDFQRISELTCPFDADDLGIRLRWAKSVDDYKKADLMARVMDNYDDYASKASICKRAEEVDEEWLYEPVWSQIN